MVKACLDIEILEWWLDYFRDTKSTNFGVLGHLSGKDKHLHPTHPRKLAWMP